MVEKNIIIEGNTGVWEMKLDGDIQGTFTGIFRFRCYLTPSQKIAADREMRELIGVNPTVANEHESYLAFALTQLKQRIISAPPFWTSTLQTSGISGDLPDENIIIAVLDASLGAESKYKGQLKQKKVDAIEKVKKAAEKILRTQEENPQEEKDPDESED